MKNIVVFGGGTGMSQILKGLKLFPLNVTAVVSVSDNGRSTGTLRQIYDIPAVGDITKVLLTMGNYDSNLKKLLDYRVKGISGCEDINHSIKNLILTALIDIKGNLSDAILEFCNIFEIDGSVLPLTEDCVNLVAKMSDGKTIVGEEEITEAKKSIDSIWYDKEFTINSKVIKAIENANLIIFSPGSLFTSILPHLIKPEVTEAINKSKANKMYICNLITQPGETMNFTVSKHLKVLESYLGKESIEDEVNNMNIKLIADKIFKIEDNIIRHDSLRTAYLVYSYLMGDK